MSALVGPSDSLELRFTRFLEGLPGAEAIDRLVLPDDPQRRRKADYLLKGRKVIVELKTLTDEQKMAILADLGDLVARDRDEVVLDEDVLAVEISGERTRHVGDRDRNLPLPLDQRLDQVEDLAEAIIRGLHHDLGATACETRAWVSSCSVFITL